MRRALQEKSGLKMELIDEKSIKLHYFRSRSGIPNFGDELSRDVVEFVTGRTITRSSRYSADLVAIGSILDRYLSNKGKIA
jgi:hypothetical protein